MQMPREITIDQINQLSKLLIAYRSMRAVDGGRGRVFDAIALGAFDDVIDEMEKPLIEQGIIEPIEAIKLGELCKTLAKYKE